MGCTSPVLACFRNDSSSAAVATFVAARKGRLVLRRAMLVWEIAARSLSEQD